MKTRADSKQEEFISSNRKLYINIEQEEKTDEDGGIYWEMVTLEISDKREAYNAVIAYFEAQQARPIRELAINPDSEFAKNKIVYLEEQIAKYR